MDAAQAAGLSVRIGLEISAAQFNAAGTARYSLELARALREADFSGCEIIELRAGNRRLPEPGPARKLFVLWWEWAYCPLVLPRRAQRLGLDLLHCTAPMPIPAHLRTVATLHDVIPLSHPDWFPAVMRWRLRRWIASAARAQHVLASSAFTRTEIIRHLPIKAARVSVVPLGQRAAPPASPKHGARYFLAVGTLEPRKNLATTLRAYSRLRKHWPAAPPLKVVGGQGWGGVRAEALLAELDLHDAVELLGHVSDEMLWRLYAGAVCLVYPSLHEGFGLPPLEAMACGCPVIAANTGSLPEVVGEAGVLVDPLDVEAIAAAMQRLAEDANMADELRRRGRARAATFTWERCARETVTVYRRVLGA
ncbi:MAG: glycosyltransferase family 4 protein [Anaerolineales bacterium]|nr:glycosyltransferase family 4 protein [Anaerolineales bacterium]MDW8325822.1 glycosyltransferase family 1 protein [Anaerolineales bacterium]